MRDIQASGGMQGGEGLAQAAWIVGWIGLGISALSIIARIVGYVHFSGYGN